jgi:putative chitinase
MLTLSMMQAMWPQGNSRIPGLVEGIGAAAPTVFPRYALTSDALIAHAMAQFSHECGNGRDMTENIAGYTPQRASEVWPSRFSSAADCLAKVGSRTGDPEFPNKLIDQVYGGRNGNRPGTHDGSRYIGRGLAQTTGRANYEKLGNRMGLDLLGNPELVNDPAHALECGVAMFVLCGCVPFAVADNVEMVTRKLNGGTVGLEDRIHRLAQWKNAFLQASLNRLGASPALATDGVFGKKSIDALMVFQRKKGLEPTGKADAMTLAAVDKDLAAT